MRSRSGVVTSLDGRVVGTLRAVSAAFICHAFHRGKDLVYTARVRAGFVPRTRREVFEKIGRLTIAKCTFVKSSILRAGVFPRLRAAEDSSIVIFEDWRRLDFIAALKAEIAKRSAPGAIPDPSAVPLGGLLMERHAEGVGPLIIVLDQFEEYLALPAQRDRDTFDLELARAIQTAQKPGSICTSGSETNWNKGSETWHEEGSIVPSRW